MTLARWTPPRLISERHADQRTVEWLELFYDLVYVAALIQLGQILVDDLSWAGVAEFVALFTLLWWTWTATTNLKSRVDVDDLMHRFLVFAQMFGIGSAAVVIGQAFDGRSQQFAAAFSLIQLTLALMFARLWRRIPSARTFTSRHLVANSIATALWVASIPAPPPARHWLWAAAFLASFSWVLSARDRQILARDFPPDLEHLTERYALLTIIVLGESFIKVVSAVADKGGGATTYVHGLLAFLTAVGLWWTYFDDVADSPIKRRADRTVGTTLWSGLHLPLTMGLTAVGVGLKQIVLTDLGHDVDPAGAWILIGALSLVFVSVAGIDAITKSLHFGVRDRDRITWRLVAVVLLTGFGLAGPLLTTTSLAALVVLVVVAQIAIEALVAKRADAAMRVDVGRVVNSPQSETVCTHLASISDVEPESAGCARCIKNGMVWVHLRYCTTCGQVGCCDDSQGRHAAEHFIESAHPTIRSREPGEDWAWCYVDEEGLQTVTHRQPPGDIGNETH